MINHGISVEGQVHLANALGQAVVNQAAVPHLNEQNRGLYLYDEIGSGNVEALADIAWFVPFPPQGVRWRARHLRRDARRVGRFLKA